MREDVVTDEETQYSSTSSGGTGSTTVDEEAEAQHLTRPNNNLYQRWSTEISRIKSRLDRHLFSVVKRTQNRVDSVFACHHVLLESSDDGFTSEDNELFEKQRMFMKRRRMQRLKQAAAKQCPIAVSDIKLENNNRRHDIRAAKSSTPKQANCGQNHVTALQFDPKAKGYITLASASSVRSETTPRSATDKTLRSTSDKTAHLSNLTKHVEERRRQQLAVNFEIIEEQDDVVSDSYLLALDYVHQKLADSNVLVQDEDPTIDLPIEVREAKSEQGSSRPTLASGEIPALVFNDSNGLKQFTLEIRNSPDAMTRLSINESGVTSQQSGRQPSASEEEESHCQVPLPPPIQTLETKLRRIPRPTGAPSPEIDIKTNRSIDLSLTETPPLAVWRQQSIIPIGESDSFPTLGVKGTSDKSSTDDKPVANARQAPDPDGAVSSNMAILHECLPSCEPDPDGAISSNMAIQHECPPSCEPDAVLAEKLVDDSTSSQLDSEGMTPLDGSEGGQKQAQSIESASYGDVRSAALDDAQNSTLDIPKPGCNSPLFGPPEQMPTLKTAKMSDGTKKKRSSSRKTIGCGRPEDVAEFHKDCSELSGTAEIYLNDIKECTSDLTWFTHDRPLSTIIVVKRKEAGADEQSSQPRNFAPKSIAEDDEQSTPGKHQETNIHEKLNQPPSDIRYGTEIPLIDPKGDHGLYTGVLLRETPCYFGEMNYPNNGKFYQGTWDNGMWNGTGHVVFPNGDTYSGQFVNDVRQGIGRYCWADGRIYDGGFVNDKRDGIGTYYWPDGSVYAGGFQKGSRHGDGVLVFHDRSVYCGEWMNGHQEGIGECVWNDGRYYKGEWKEGQVHGRGIEVRSDGIIRHDGEWKCGRPVRTRKQTGSG